jgi:hypothetical protein
LKYKLLTENLAQIEDDEMTDGRSVHGIDAASVSQWIGNAHPHAALVVVSSIPVVPSPPVVSSSSIVRTGFPSASTVRFV